MNWLPCAPTTTATRAGCCRGRDRVGDRCEPCSLRLERRASKIRIGRTCRLLAGCGFALVATFGCRDSTSSSGPTSVAVTSPIGTILALGRTVQLAATAFDQSGNPIPGIQLTWQSSNATVASVSATGLVTATGVGFVEITASAGTVSARIALRVVQADLETVSVLAGDALGRVLIAALSAAKHALVEAAWNACAAAATTGNLEAVVDCVDDLRAEAASASDPTDRALLAVLALYVDQIRRLSGF